MNLTKGMNFPMTIMLLIRKITIGIVKNLQKSLVNKGSNEHNYNNNYVSTTVTKIPSFNNSGNLSQKFNYIENSVCKNIGKMDK